MKINEKHLSLMSSDILYAKFLIKQNLTLYAAYEDDIADPSTSGNRYSIYIYVYTFIYIHMYIYTFNNACMYLLCFKIKSF